MAMASAVKVALGSIAFLVFWVLAVFPAVPFLPIGRTAGSLLGALLMVIFRVITPEQAFDAIDLPILGLLFGTMVVSVYLEKADMFMYLGKLLSWKSWGSRDLLCRICIISAISSALFTNDTTCVVLTEFVLKIARQKGLPPHPYLLALASSANIGSSATPIGNPQNLVIAVQSGISFGEFLFGVGPAMIVGVCVNALLLVGMYWNLLSSEKKDGGEDDVVVVVEEDQDVGSHRFSPAAMSHQSSANGRDLGDGIESTLSNLSTVRNRVVYSENVEIKEAGNGEMESTMQSSNLTNSNDWSMKWKRVLWKACVYLVTLGMLVSLLMGLNMSWTAITAALALVVLDFKDARPSLEKVSYSLLIFFCGMFITVEGFNRTGIPSALWDFIEPYAKINKASGLAILAAIILLLSNVVSNVPTVLLLGGRIAATAATISAREEKRSWLVLAWVSTVAGNLSLLGSAANLIVCEQARQTPHLSYTLSFWRHLKFGFPSTLIVTAIGLTLVRG